MFSNSLHCINRPSFLPILSFALAPPCAAESQDARPPLPLASSRAPPLLPRAHASPPRTARLLYPSFLRAMRDGLPALLASRGPSAQLPHAGLLSHVRCLLCSHAASRAPLCPRVYSTSTRVPPPSRTCSCAPLLRPIASASACVCASARATMATESMASSGKAERPHPSPTCFHATDLLGRGICYNHLCA